MLLSIFGISTCVENHNNLYYLTRCLSFIFLLDRRRPRRPSNPIIRNMTNITKNRKNNIFAIPAAATAMPPNPNAAAIIAMIKKISAQLNITAPCKDYPVH